MTIVEPPPIQVYPVPPVVVPGPDGTPIELPFPHAIPEQGVPVHINNGKVYVWKALSDWIQQKSTDDWFGKFDRGAEPVKLNIQAVFDAIFTALHREQEAWASFVNLQADYLLGVAVQSLKNDIHLLETVATLFRTAKADTFADRLRINTIENVIVPTLLRAIQDTQTFTNAALQRQSLVLKQWSVDHIFQPMRERIAQEATRRQIADDHITQTVIPAVRADLMQQLAPVVVTATAALGIARKVATWVDECGAPMCDTMGPKTDLGKALKALGGLLGLLAGVELAHLTEADLEHLAHVLASIGERGATALLDDFVEGGADIGDAAHLILGDIGSAGRAVLDELGVPGL